MLILKNFIQLYLRTMLFPLILRWAKLAQKLIIRDNSKSQFNFCLGKKREIWKWVQCVFTSMKKNGSLWNPKKANTTKKGWTTETCWISLEPSDNFFFFFLPEWKGQISIFWGDICRWLHMIFLRWGQMPNLNLILSNEKSIYKESQKKNRKLRREQSPEYKKLIILNID